MHHPAGGIDLMVGLLALLDMKSVPRKGRTQCLAESCRRWERVHRVDMKFLSSLVWLRCSEAFSSVAIALRFVQEVGRFAQNSCGWGMTLLWLLLSCKLLNGST